MDQNGKPQRSFKTIKRFNLTGHVHFLTFSCYQRLPLLTDDLWRMWLADSIRRACYKWDTSLWAYVFMPDHVHLLVKPRPETYDVSLFLRSVKNSVAKRVISRLRKSDSPILGQLTQSSEASSAQFYRFWQAGPGYDKNIWSPEKAIEKARYCHRNPVTRGLVDDQALWRWSSYRWLELGQRDNEPLMLDNWVEGAFEE